jgi:branched-chain amino acid transport system permease protein
MGLDAPGTKAVAYGAMLIAVIWLRPSGIWPWLARRLGLA